METFTGHIWPAQEECYAEGRSTARQWKIIQTLITSRRGKSAAELADDIECHPQTLYRDLEALQVWFSADAAGYIKEKIWHDTQEIISQKDGSIVFEAEVAGTEEIKFRVMSWGPKAMVIEPSFLRQEIRAEAEAMAEK